MNGYLTLWSPLMGNWMSAHVAKASPIVQTAIGDPPTGDETAAPDEETAPDTLRDLPPPTLRSV